MEVYRAFVGPFPGCSSYNALCDIYRTAQPPLPDDPAQSSLDILLARDSKMFFPRSAIKKILDKPRIREILNCSCDRCKIGRESGKVRFDTLVEWVSNNGQIVLAVLIYLGHTWLIKSLGEKADKISDDNLDAVFSIIANRQPAGLPKAFKESYQCALYLFQPPRFTLGSPTLVCDDRQRFPYLNEEFVARGSFAEVYKFEIHPDYLDKDLTSKYTDRSASVSIPKCMVEYF